MVEYKRHVMLKELWIFDMILQKFMYKYILILGIILRELIQFSFISQKKKKVEDVQFQVSIGSDEAVNNIDDMIVGPLISEKNDDMDSSEVETQVID